MRRPPSCMTANEKLPVILVTGFLGSGKTTLLNALLADGVNTAVIINEFGEVPVDQALLQQQGLPLTVLSGGCLCCQVKGALSPTLKNLWMAWHNATAKPFDRIIIETSGIASPAPLLDTLLRERWIAKRYRLQQVITTVSALSASAQLTRFAEARSQVVWADTILMTHTDQADAATVSVLTAELAALAPTTPAVRQPYPCPVADMAQFGAPGLRALSNTSGPAHDFHSVSLTLKPDVTPGDVETAVHALLRHYGDRILRIKGLIYDWKQNRTVVMQAANGRCYPAVRAHVNDTGNRLVVIVDQALADPTATLSAELSGLVAAEK